MRMLSLAVVFGLALVARVEAAPPKLIVAILVDQLRYDYLERLHPHFVTNGFRLFMDRGSVMTFAHFNYVPTVTGPGHASFLSGSTPNIHGIIGNDWYDRKAGKTVGCVDDQSVDGVGATPGKARSSPKNFTGSTFADELRLRFGSKVVGISIKDRGAILPAGKKPTGAYWFHSNNGNFVTSTYYHEQLPSWVQAFNQRKRPADFMGKTWERLLDEKLYPFPDDAEWEEKLAEEKKPVFPHIIANAKSGFGNIESSPFSNQLLAEFAEAAIEGEQLGQSDRPDLLCVSFSAIDSVGHKFGPHSHEVQDMVLRLDRQLAGLFEFLDKRIGLANVAMTLTADHGVAPVPEQAKSEGLDGQRYDEAAFMTQLKEHLDDRFGAARFFSYSKLSYGHIFLNETALERKKLSLAEVSNTIREFALASGKYQACYTREQLLDGRAPGFIGQLVLNGYHAERGGDLVLVAKPFFLPGTGKTGTTHASPYAYDTHVPVLFYGSLFVPGRFADDFAITDIVPTLSAALRMNEPAGCVGKPLVKLLAQP